MSEIKLLPCPFCGGEATLHNNFLTDKFKVWCNECDCRTDVYSDKEEAIEKWNTRKTMERIVDRLEGKKWGIHYWKDEWRNKIIGECIDVVKEEGGIE